MRELLLLTALFITSFGRKTFEGDQVLRITARNDLQFNLLKNLSTYEHLELDFWMEPRHQSLPVDVRVPLTSLKAFKDFLKDSDIQYEIMIQNLQDLLDEEQREMMRSRALQPRNTDEFEYGNYHTLNEIYNFIDMLVQENPKFVSKIKIGESYEGRPLIVLKFSKGPNRPGIWIDAGIHSREWISHASATWFAKKIVRDHNKFWKFALKSILKKCDIFLEIVVNPDGYVFTHQSDDNRFWRKSRCPIEGSKCVGVDLNRNWDAGFGGEGSSNDPCNDRYHGPSAHSEPEVKAIVDFKSHVKLKAFVSIHSYSQMLLYPYGYTDSLCNDHTELDKLAKKAITELKRPYNTKYTYGSSIKTICKARGTSIDWAYDQGIKYSYTFELRPDGNISPPKRGFVLPANQIIPTARETWRAIMAIMEHTVKHLY